MLKKAGIIVATAAAGLLAVSSFAFADETTTTGNQANTCSFDQTGTTTSENQNVALSLVGAAANTPAANAVTPILAQLPILNCNNLGVSDLVDDNSGNETVTKTVSKTEDSNNTDSDD